jgi:deoxyribodipyrimidine photolyase
MINENKTAIVWFRNDLRSYVIYISWKVSPDQLDQVNIMLAEEYPVPMIDLEASFEETKQRFRQYG